jgi:outer membrane protein
MTAFRVHGRGFTVALCATVLIAMPASAQSLSEALAMAYDGSPRLAAARAELRATMEGLPAAQAQLWRPQVTLSGNVTQSFLAIDDEVDGDETEQGLDQEYAYEVEVPLFDAEVLGEIDGARADIRVGLAQLTEIEQTLFQSVVEAYADVLLYREQIALYGEEVARLRGEADQAARMLERARRTRGDVASIREQLNETLGLQAEAYGELAAADASFVELVGQAPQTLDLWPELPGVPNSLEEALLDAEALSPAIRRAQEQIASAEADIDSSLGQIMPQLSFVHSYTHSRDDIRYAPTGSASYNDIDTEDEFTFELSLSVPIYQGGEAQAEVRAAKQSLSQARLDLTARQRQVVQDVTAAWSRLQAAWEARGFARDRLAEARDAEAGRAYQLERQEITVDDFLDSQQTRIDAQIDALQVDHDILLRTGELLAAMGKLTAREQALAVDAYDPAADLERADGRWFGFGD